MTSDGEPIVDDAVASSRHITVLTHLLALASVAVSWAIAWIYDAPRFYAVDDSVIQWILSGAAFGEPSAYAVYVNVALGNVFAALFSVAPSVPWWFVWLVGGTLVSMYAIDYCALHLVMSGPHELKGPYLLVPLVILVPFNVVLLSLPLLQATFTFTANVMASASVLMLWLYMREGGGAGKGKHHIGHGVLSLLLMVGGLCTRESAALAVIPFFVAVAVLGLLCPHASAYVADVEVTRARNKAQARRFGTMMVGVFICVTVCVAVNRIAYSTPEWSQFKSMDYARSDYCDYPHPSFDERPDLYESVGWNRTVSNLVDTWLFFDERITEESFDALAVPPVHIGLAESFGMAVQSIFVNPTTLILGIVALCVVMTIGMLCFVHRFTQSLFLLTCWSIALGELTYLSLEGRMLERVEYVCLLPLVLALVGPTIAYARETLGPREPVASSSAKDGVFRAAAGVLSLGTVLGCAYQAMTTESSRWQVLTFVLLLVALLPFVLARRMRLATWSYVLGLAVVLVMSAGVLKSECLEATQSYRDVREVVQSHFDYAESHPDLSYFVVGGDVSYDRDPLAVGVPGNVYFLGGWQFFLPQNQKHFAQGCKGPMSYGLRLTQEDVRLMVYGESTAEMIASSVQETTGMDVVPKQEDTLARAVVYRLVRRGE